MNTLKEEFDKKTNVKVTTVEKETAMRKNKRGKCKNAWKFGFIYEI